jgi:hypothetical protein
MNEIRLLDQDETFLKEKGYEFDLFVEGSEVHIVIKNFPLSAQYSPNKADMLIKIPPGYPDAPLDMFWTDPEIKLSNGQAPQATETRETHHERTWQRWSRHYAWRPGVDSLKNFLRSIHSELQKNI